MYELVEFDALPAGERARLGSLPDDPGLFGVLRPRLGDALLLKAVGHDTARLFGALAQPGGVDDLRDLQVPSADELERLVLGGVLELADGDRFVSGPAAVHVLAAGEMPAAGRSRVGRLSLAALRYAAALPIEEAGRLSARMYFYNRVPAGPRWHRLFPDPAAVRAFLGLDPGGRNRALIDERWDEDPHEEAGGWIHWHGLRRSGRRARSGPFKLYVSPAPDDVGRAFDATVATLGALDTTCSFKVGPDVHGLLRPDKLVVYLSSRAELDAVAEALAPALAGVRAQGVPFSAELAGEGVLSWGLDPPRRRGNEWWERESWRLWVTNRLAAAILAARSAPAGVEPWRFALRRIESEGVDLATWAPLDQGAAGR